MKTAAKFMFLISLASAPLWAITTRWGSNVNIQRIVTSVGGGAYLFLPKGAISNPVDTTSCRVTSPESGGTKYELMWIPNDGMLAEITAAFQSGTPIRAFNVRTDDTPRAPDQIGPTPCSIQYIDFE